MHCSFHSDCTPSKLHVLIVRIKLTIVWISMVCEHVLAIDGLPLDRLAIRRAETLVVATTAPARHNIGYGKRQVRCNKYINRYILASL